MNRMTSLTRADQDPRATVGVDGRGDKDRRADQDDLLDPARMVSFAGELDAAAAALKAMAGRMPFDASRTPVLARAAACYGAAHLLRRIAE